MGLFRVALAAVYLVTAGNLRKKIVLISSPYVNTMTHWPYWLPVHWYVYRSSRVLSGIWCHLHSAGIFDTGANMSAPLLSPGSLFFLLRVWPGGGTPGSSKTRLVTFCRPPTTTFAPVELSDHMRVTVPRVLS